MDNTVGDHLPKIGEPQCKFTCMMLGSLRPCRVLQSVLRWSRASVCSSTSSRPGSVEVKEKEPQGKEINVAVSSLRVDTVAAAGLDISRKYVRLSSVCMCKR